MSIARSSDAAIDAVQKALERGCDDHRSSDAEFDNLAELAVRVIRFEGGSEIAKVMGAVDGVRREATKRQQPVVAAHLAMVSRLLAAAATLRLPLPDGLAESDKLILSHLGSGPLSGRALASSTGLTVETVARRLPRLRAAGLVDSWKEGRQTSNHRTKLGDEAVSSRTLPPAVPVVPSGPTVNQDLRKVVRKQSMASNIG